MMIHFAYPNVIPRESKFLGCGRYVTAVLGEAPDDSYWLVELNIPNITEVHLAALQLAPETIESKKVIYERRDAPSQAYLGESRDFAYILALINRTRSIRFLEDRTYGDIWCTGCIDIKGENHPFLKAVDVSGFSCKLKAFLSEKNPDKLFFVPAQNVLPTHEVLFQKSDVHVVSLKQFQQNLSNLQDVFARKTIVKVQGDELEDLVNILFNTPEQILTDHQPVLGINPYQGLFAFQEQDAEFFFGRESYIKQLVEAVRSKPFVAVIGPSGIGKSSVVYAGLIPQLRRQKIPFREPVLSEVEGEIERGSSYSPLEGGRGLFFSSEGHKVVGLREENSPPTVGGVRGGGTNQPEIPDKTQVFTESPNSCSPPPNLPHQGGGIPKSTALSEGQGRKIPSWEGQEWVNWLVAAFRPGTAPFHALSSALLPLLEPEKSAVEQLVEIKRMAENLKSGDLNLEDILEAILSKTPNSHFLLCADQFEELYTLCREEDERRRFLDELLSILPIPPSPYPPTSPSPHLPISPVPYLPSSSLVLTMRADFLGKAFSYRPFADALQNASLILGPMNREELRDVIEKPAEKCGIHIEHGLTRRILDAVSGEPGHLPLLEFALTQLWEQQAKIPSTHGILSHAAYDDIGGVEQALTCYAERVYENLTQEEQKQAQQIFTQLAHPGEGTEDTRRIATRSDVGEENWDLVTKLADVRLIVTSRNPGNIGIMPASSSHLIEKEKSRQDACAPRETVEVVHEALIQGWQRLRKWIESDREFRTWQDRLRTAIYQWKESNYDEGTLLRGVPLGEAENWLNTRRNRLARSEQNFIESSLQARKRLKRRYQFGIMAGFVISVVIALFFVVLWNNAETQRRIAEIAAIKAQIQTSRALFLSKEDDLGALLVGVKTGKNSTRMTLPTNLKHQIRFNLREVVHGIHEKNRLEGHELPVKSVSFSPDSKMLASGSNDRTIRLWNVTDGSERMTLFGHWGSIKSVAFSPDGNLLASGSADTTIKLWNVADGRKRMTLYGHWSPVLSVNFSPDGTLLASGSTDGAIKLWNVSNGRELMTLGGSKRKTFPKFVKDSLFLFRFRKTHDSEIPLQGHSDAVQSVSFSSDGTVLASGSADKTIKLWNVADGREIMTLRGHSHTVWSVNFSPDDVLLASGSEDHTVKLWNVADGRERMTLQGHSDAVRSVNFSPDGSLLASGSDELDRTIKLWNVADGREVNTFKGHYNSVVSLHFSPNSTLLASGSDDYSIKLWDITKGDEPATLHMYSENVASVMFSPDGRLLASGNHDNTITLWDIKNRRELMTLRGHSSVVQSLCFSPDGTLLASGSNDTTIKLWHVGDGREFLTLHGHDDAVQSLSFSSEGSLLVSGSSDHTIKLWDIVGGSELATLQGHTKAVLSISLSPNDTLLVSGSEDGTIKLWQIREGREIRTLYSHATAVRSVAFSPDGALFASGGDDHRIKLWHVADGRQIYTLRGHSHTLLSLAFSPDGALLASGSYDHTIKIWDVADGSEVTTLHGHSDAVNSLAFSPNGTLLASGSHDHTIKLWNFDLDDLLVHGCKKLHSYLKNNPNVSDEDRLLCDNIYEKRKLL